MPADPQKLAEVLVVAIKHALAPVQERLAVLEAKTAVPLVDPEMAGLRERVAVLETRPLLPGPPGKDGEPGPPGQDGKPGLTYQGVFQEGKSYDVGELVTWGGSMWHCNEPTETKPGESSKAWTLTVKRGRDGKGT